MGKDTLSIRTVQHWFTQLKSSNFELNDSQHSERPVEVNVDFLKQRIEENPRLTTCCSAERPVRSDATVETHLSKLGKTWKYGV